MPCSTASSLASGPPSASHLRPSRRSATPSPPRPGRFRSAPVAPTSLPPALATTSGSTVSAGRPTGKAAPWAAPAVCFSRQAVTPPPCPPPPLAVHRQQRHRLAAGRRQQRLQACGRLARREHHAEASSALVVRHERVHTLVLARMVRLEGVGGLHRLDGAVWCPPTPSSLTPLPRLPFSVVPGSRFPSFPPPPSSSPFPPASVYTMQSDDD